MIVTVEQLDSMGACAEQVELVAAMWGHEVEVTRETCAEAAALGLDVEWAVDNLLPKAIREAYRAQIKPLDDAYRAQRKPLCDAYHAQRKPLYAAYLAQCWALFGDIVTGA